MRFWLVFLSVTVFSINALAEGKWKFRAREHFEFHKIKTGEDQELNYRGFSNTINFWYEVPYRYSYGLAAGPLLGSAKRQDSSPPEVFGNTIRLFTLGVEAKYFPLPDQLKLFVRGGTGWAWLSSTRTKPNPDGFQIYAGTGYEIPIGKFSLAPEVAYRFSRLKDGVRITSLTPSIGFHFYEMF